MTHLCLYLHGFNSSGLATKAQLLGDALKPYPVDFQSPHLSHQPALALTELRAIIGDASPNKLSLVGSSLGGFYAMVLSQQYPDAKCVLVNPATRPWVGGESFVGEHVNTVTGEPFTVTAQDAHDMKQYLVDTPVRFDRFLLLLQTDDDVIDYRIAQHEFSQSTQIISTGGGHRFENFGDFLPQVLEFLWD